MAVKSKGPGKVASMLPDEMSTGGLPDDFDGTITEVRLVKWNYDGRRPDLDPILATRVTITPAAGQDVGEDAIVQHYSAGDLNHFVPSEDGEEGVDLDDDNAAGVYALAIGQREQLNNNSNWAHFVGYLLDSGFDRKAVTPAVDCFEGVFGHFNRMPQKKRPGLKNDGVAADGGEQKVRTILVCTEIKKAPAGASKSAGAGKSAAAKGGATKASSNGGGDMDESLVEIVKEALSAAKDNTLPKAKITAAVVKGYTGSDKAKAIKRASSQEFLEGFEDAFIFDADSGTVTLIEG